MKKSRKFEPNHNSGNFTAITCAKCFFVARIDGHATLLCCPKCGSTNPALTRVRHWTNGIPDYSVNWLGGRRRA